MAAEANLNLLCYYYYSLFSICFPLLLLLLLLHSDPTTAASSSSRVTHLPGFDGPLPFHLETGYVNVDDFNDVHLFYYFVKSETNPSEDPVVFWFPGGPSCSGLYSFFYEIGPITTIKEKYNGSLPRLQLKPYSWTKMANIIFADSPVDTGFSYSNTLEGSYSSDTKSAKKASIFVQKWLTDHPEFLSNPLYIGGSSYSGLVVPIIVQDISDGIEAGDKPLLNLKGYLLGNPMTIPALEKNMRLSFAFGMSIIPTETFESAKRNCGRDYVNFDYSNAKCTKALQVLSECTSRLDDDHILYHKCVSDVAPREATIRDRSSLESSNYNSLSKPPVPEFECRTYSYMLSYYWANDDDVQKALNIRKGTIQEWIRCKFDRIHYSYDIKNSFPYHLNLSKKHCRTLIYSGDHDLIVPTLSTQEWISSLNLSIRDDWRPWLIDEQIGGYTRTYTNNMTFATIKGGGHTAAEFNPKEAFLMAKKWFSIDIL